MNYSLDIFTKKLLLIGLLLINGFAIVNPTQAAVSGTIALTNIPLATSSSNLIKPNLLLVLDDSGSMSWDHMPDDSSDGGSSVSFQYGYYGLRSSQCNQVYYDPSYNYLPPVKADGTLYANATFGAARSDGFVTGSSTVNLDNSFKASLSLNADSTGQSAYYYAYSGVQNTPTLKNYNDNTSTFYSECNVGRGSTTPPSSTTIFTKRRLATTVTTTIVVSGSNNTSVSQITVGSTNLMTGASTANNTPSIVASNIVAKISAAGYSASASGSTITITGPTSVCTTNPTTKLVTCSAPVVTVASGSMTFATDVFPDTTAANLTNFANWYSYYRTRMLMMKTATGRSFGSLNGSDYRVGLMQISQTGAPTVRVGLFTGSQRTTWFNSLYGVSPSGSTPLRRALSEAGRYYAGNLGGTDPLQYSCQQNFSILTTDGYWNTGDGYQMNGSAAVGNQDDTASRPLYDGAQTNDTVTTYYTQRKYTVLSGRSGGCAKGEQRLVSQLQRFSCTDTTLAAESCGTTTDVGSQVVEIACRTASITAPSPNPTARVLDAGTTPNPVTTAGSAGGSSDSLSDVAMYYYTTDLRPGTCTLCEDNVFVGSKLDNNPQQHMTTFTLGLGASGRMRYSPTYETDNVGDYAAVKHGDPASATVCTWQATGTVCNWPLPGMSGSDGLIANIDDLWHAAIDGRGAYFSATNPDTLSTGLTNALAAIQSHKGAGAAAATSTLNPVADNNLAYVASYTTVLWQGNLEARGVDPDTGITNQNAEWCVEDILADSCSDGSSPVILDNTGVNNAAFCVVSNATVSSCPDGVLASGVCTTPAAKACTGKLPVQVANNTRKIWTKGTGESALNNFKSTTDGGVIDPSSFALSGITQWTAAAPDGWDATQKNLAPTKIVDYLRGSHDYELSSSTTANQLFRIRTASLGDAVESQPAFVGPPTFSYVDTGYSAFKTAKALRSGTVYMGANDGMMHAFDASTDTGGAVSATAGNERWAYVPSMVIPSMWKLADSQYKDTHQFFVNGSPVIGDVYDSVASTWKTILVGGLGGGGRGYYALDITNPALPILLWEFTTANNANLGYSYGNPIITKKSNGDWVVLLTSGYDNGDLDKDRVTSNSPLGDGKGYLYVVNAIGGPASVTKPMVTISTGAGTGATPSGLAQLSAWADEPEKNNMATFVYGGDLLGNVWRFDINAGTKMQFAKLCANSTGTCDAQPITTRPELGKVLASGKAHRVVFIATGKYLESSDVSDTQQGTIYAIKDDDATTTVTNPRTLTSTTPNGMVQQVISGNPPTVTSNPVNFGIDLGWFVDFPVLGERVNVPTRLESGTLIVPTLRPTSTVCKAGGDGRLFAFNYKTGSSIGSHFAFDADAPIVGINIVYIDGKPVVSIVTSKNPTPQLIPDVPFSDSGNGFQKKRVIWRELIQ